MHDFPEFMKTADNAVATQSQSTGVKGWVYDGRDDNATERGPKRNKMTIEREWPGWSTIKNGIPKAVILFYIAMLLGSCATAPINPTAIRGQWQFAYVRQAKTAFGQFPAPPQFDAITFMPPTQIEVHSSTRQASFDGTYTLAGNQLVYEFQPPGVKKPIRHTLTCMLSNHGNALLLTHENTEMVYYRPQRFYANTIAGEWTVTAKDKTETMQLGKDGSYRLVESQVVGHYRLWPSRYGKAMTTLVTVPGQGGHLWIWKYERQGNRLTMTPISWNGPLKKGTVTWTHKKTARPTTLSLHPMISSDRPF